jgi:FMN phosphatase YigB (HAD superfamily)
MKVRKPSLEFYRNVLLYSNLRADEVLYVGDSIKLDIQPALLLGIKAVLIDRLDLYPNAAVNRIRTMSELQQYL